MLIHYEGRAMPRPRHRTTHGDALLALLRQAPHARLELAAKLGMAPATLSRLLDDLRGEGHEIVSVGQGRARFYRLESSPKEGTP